MFFSKIDVVDSAEVLFNIFSDSWLTWPPPSDLPRNLVDAYTRAIDKNDETYADVRKGGHCLIYARTDVKLWNEHQQKALVMVVERSTNA